MTTRSTAKTRTAKAAPATSAAAKVPATKTSAARKAAAGKPIPKKPVASKAAPKKVEAGKKVETSPTPSVLPPVKPKHKLVRDSFTIPKVEYLVLDALKQRAADLKRPTKKSELLRAGIAALNAMPDKAFLATLDGVPSLKTGRPKTGAEG